MERRTDFTIKTVQMEDISFLWSMLYEAVAIDVSMRRLGKEKALKLPVNRKYVEGWGRPGDAGVIALDGERLPLGAAWYRCYPVEAPGYGFISLAIPEMSIGVNANVHNQGIGSALLRELIVQAQSQGYTALSLSVDRNNPALHLYKRFGFRDAGISKIGDASVTMIKQFRDDKKEY